MAAVDTVAAVTVVAMVVDTVADTVADTEVAMAVVDTAVALVAPHEALPEMGMPSDEVSCVVRQLDPRFLALHHVDSSD